MRYFTARKSLSMKQFYCLVYGVLLMYAVLAILLSNTGRFSILWRKVAHSDSESTITILLWHAPEPYRNHFIRDREEIVDAKMRRECGGCRMTTDRSAFNTSQVIVLYGTFLRGQGDFPVGETRTSEQKYVFWSRENPYHTKHVIKGKAGLESFDSEFNLSMTYRSDSDIQLSRGCLTKLRRRLIEEDDALVFNKTKVAVMLASDCVRFGAIQRLKYANRLIQSGLELDRFGKCFGKRYEGNVTALLNPYRFFLSFENAMHCREYITEKFWAKALEEGLVPVVWGPTKKDVELVAPVNSYIHVEDFSSARELADYLMYLSRNNSAYMEYFKWRDASRLARRDESYCGMPATARVPRGFCELCQKVKYGRRISEIPSITSWWYGTEPPECLAKNLSQEFIKNVERLLP